MSDTPRTDALGKDERHRNFEEIRYWTDQYRILARQLERELAATNARLPDGMKDCTILFKECALGHGWLTATNWVQHGCPTCAIAAANAKLAAQGHITFVTREGDPELMAVTRTDDEGRILETLWERPALRPDPLGEALNSGDGSYRP